MIKQKDTNVEYLRTLAFGLQTQLNRVERAVYRMLKKQREDVEVFASLGNLSVEELDTLRSIVKSGKQFNERIEQPEQPKQNIISQPKLDSNNELDYDINSEIPIPGWFKEQDNYTDYFKELINVLLKGDEYQVDTLSPETNRSLKALYPNKEDRILAVDGDCFITREIHKLNYVFCFAYKPDPKSESGYARELSTLDNRLTKHGNNSTKFYLKFATKYGLLDS